MTRSAFSYSLIALVCIGLLSYGLFEARRLIAGPEITLQTPRDGQRVAGPLLHIIGVAHNVAFFSIDGEQAYVDQNGRFDRTISAPPGYTVITVSGKDRFGRVQSRAAHITIVNYCPAYVA